MTKKEFKTRWEQDDDGGGITFDDIANCAKTWGISSSPKTSPMHIITYKVLKAANVNDCEEHNPDNPDEELISANEILNNGISNREPNT